MIPTNPVRNGLFAWRDSSVPDEERKKAVRAAMVRALANQLGPLAEQFGSHINRLSPAAAGDAQIPPFGAVPGPDFADAFSPGAPGGEQLLYVDQENPSEEEEEGRAPDLNISSYEPDLPIPSPRPAPPFLPDEEQAGKTLEERLEEVTIAEMSTGRPALPIETCRAVRRFFDPAHGATDRAKGKIDVVCTRGGNLYPLDALAVRAWREWKTRKYPLFDPDPKLLDPKKKRSQWSEGALDLGSKGELFIKFDDWNDIHDVGEVFASDRPGLELLKPGRVRQCRDGRNPNYRPEGAYEDGETMGHLHRDGVEPTVGPDDGGAAKLTTGVTYMISEAGAFRINRDRQGIYSVTLLAGSWGRTSTGTNGKKVAKELIKQWTANDGLSDKSKKAMGNLKKDDPYKGCRDVHKDWKERKYRPRPLMDR